MLGLLASGLNYAPVATQPTSNDVLSKTAARVYRDNANRGHDLTAEQTFGIICPLPSD